MGRRVNEAGLAILMAAEGLRLAAYYCPAGKLTVGYGHTGPDVSEGMTITEAEAQKLLEADLEWAGRTVEKEVTVPLNDNQFSALASLVYNIGPGAFAKSTLLRVLNEGNYLAAADEFLKWRKSGGKVLAGLEKRRAAERGLFLQGLGVLKYPEPKQEIV